jgi:hypothetical protein
LLFWPACRCEQARGGAKSKRGYLVAPRGPIP